MWWPWQTNGRILSVLLLQIKTVAEELFGNILKGKLTVGNWLYCVRSASKHLSNPLSQLA